MLRKTLWLAGAVALTLAACGDDEESNPVTPPGTTTVSVLLTDAPGDIQEAVVTIDQVSLVNSAGKVDLLTAPATVDLTDLANTTSELVAGATAENGAYSEVRLVISGAFVQVENEDGSSSIFASSPDYAGLPAGATVAGTLTIPTDASGVAATFAQPIELTGGTASLLIDFDVAQSFTQDATSGQWMLQPVLNGAPSSSATNVEVTLATGADVTLPEGVTLGNFTAQLGAEKVAFADAGDGTFKAAFSFVLPGTYTLTVLGPTGFEITTDPGNPLDVTVTAGSPVAQAFTLTAITPTP